MSAWDGWAISKILLYCKRGMCLIPNPVIRIDYQIPGDEMRILVVVERRSSLAVWSLAGRGRRQNRVPNLCTLFTTTRPITHNNPSLLKPLEMFFTLFLLCF